MSLRHSIVARAALTHAILETLEPRRLFAAGDLDLMFGGGDGQAIVPFADASAARIDMMARQSDGKLLLAGHRTPVGGNYDSSKLNLIRLETDGDLDPTFGGGDGAVELDFATNILQISVDPSSGRIAVVTNTRGLRIFDSSGNSVAGFDSIDAQGEVFQTDGKLLVANAVTFPGPIYSYVELTATDIRRYNVDGSPDDTFGDDGVKRIGVSDESNVPWHEQSHSYGFRRMIVGTDGSIYIAARLEFDVFVDNGDSKHGSGMTIFRLTPNGQLDDAFSAGQNGQITVHAEDHSDYVQVTDLVAAPNGAVTAVWSTSYDVANFFAMTLTAEGAIDLKSYNGKFQLPPAVNRPDWIDFGVDPSGRLLLSGAYRPISTGPQVNQPSLFAARFLSSGLPDYSYDDDGIYLAGPNAIGQWQAATLILPDGSVLLAGSRPDGQSVGFVVSKLQGGEGTPSPTPTITLNAKGTLMVTTSDAKDLVSLSIRQSDGRLILRSGTFAQSFAPSKVKRIALYTLGGDDQVTIGPGVRGSYVEAGDGADTLNGGQFGDVLLGGLGADQLFGNDGDDTLLGEGGDDYLLGGAGKDDLFGNGGTDILSGAGGNDRLFGGPNEADRILGGAGSDSAAQDDKDSYESIETLL